ncbi:MAG: CBS domain-containing protein, partial [Bryobacteraceae bacterium]
MTDSWEELSPPDRLSAFRSLTPDQAQVFFLNLGAPDQAEFILSLPEGERRIWLRQVAPDDTADLIQQVDDDEVEGLLSLLDDAARREVSTLLAYRQDAAGGLMSPRFARLRPEMNVDEAISYLRLQSGRVETVYYAYALDNEQRLVGVVSFRDLFAAELHRTVQQVMRTKFIAVTEDIDQEVVAELFAEHRLLAIPVLDTEGRMKGIVTVDDIVEVAREEASEDIQKLGGMEALDAPYLDTGFWEMIRKRGGWLSALFVGEML